MVGQGVNGGEGGKRENGKKDGNQGPGNESTRIATNPNPKRNYPSNDIKRIDRKEGRTCGYARATRFSRESWLAGRQANEFRPYVYRCLASGTVMSQGRNYQ